MNARMLTAMAAMLLAAASARAEQASTGVVVERPWSRATIGTTRPGVVYLTIRNEGEGPAVLSGVATPAAGRPEIHESVIRDGIARMRPAGRITIPAGGVVSLGPGDLHIMLMELKYPLEEGAMLPLTLKFREAEPLKVDVPILNIRAKGPDG